VLSVEPDKRSLLEAFMQSQGVPFYELGSTGGSVLEWMEVGRWEVSALTQVYEQAIPSLMETVISQ
jgi:hypothetical protein